MCGMRLVYFVVATATRQLYTFPYTTLFRSRRGVVGDPGRPICLDSRGLPVDRFAAQPGGSRPRYLYMRAAAAGVEDRSEEHTSELQSHSDLVCRLLLEKKKTRAAPLPRCSI